LKWIYFNAKNKSIGEDLFWDTKSEIDFSSLNIYPKHCRLVQNLHTTNLREKKQPKKNVSVGCSSGIILGIEFE
jgi:hypothetical protein